MKPAHQFSGVFALTLLLSGTASAAVIFPKVTNTNDSGPGSLRAAITAANNNGADGAIVSFDIGSACGPHVIHLSSALPDLIAEVHIEGYLQTGASKNTLTNPYQSNAVICIVLAGDNTVADGFTVPASVADALEMSVQGIAFSGFTHSAVNLRGGSNHIVAGIRTGGNVGGFALDTNSYGVILAPGVHAATIGGPDVGDINVLGDIMHNAIYVSSSSGSSVAAHGNTLANNTIGLVFQGGSSAASPTVGAAIAVGGYGNTIQDNRFEHSGAAGLHISNVDAHGNNVLDNAVESNHGDGILIDDDAHDNTIQNNGIFFNTGAGIRVANGRGNRMTFNNIDVNDGIGIDLAAEGVTPNDNDSMPPTADYANRGQNFPVLTTANGGHTGVVTGSLTSTPGDYTINISGIGTCDASGYGQGQNAFSYPNTGGDGYKITVPNITSQGQGSVSFSIPVVHYSTMSAQTYVTATATDADGNTSEFSACLVYQDDGIFYDGFE